MKNLLICLLLSSITLPSTLLSTIAQVSAQPELEKTDNEIIEVKDDVSLIQTEIPADGDKLSDKRTPVLAQFELDDRGFLVNYKNGKCAGFAPGILSDNITLQQLSCGGLNAYHQQWYLGRVMNYPNNTPAYYLQNLRNSTCIAVENDSLENAARVVQRQCDPSNPSQHWIHIAGRSSGVEEKSRWMNGRSAKCLDIWNNYDGTAFQQYTCAGSSNWGPQGFFIRKIRNLIRL